MTENELRQLEALIKKYRANFSIDVDHRLPDSVRTVSDAIIQNIRQTIRLGGTYRKYCMIKAQP